LEKIYSQINGKKRGEGDARGGRRGVSSGGVISSDRESVERTTLKGKGFALEASIIKEKNVIAGEK